MSVSAVALPDPVLTSPRDRRAANALPGLPPELLRRLHGRGSARHGVRAAIFIALYLVAAVGAWWLRSKMPAGWKGFAAAAPLYFLAAASLQGVSLFAHEAVHGTLHDNRFRNRWLGAACAWPVLQNFAAYKVLHLRHHNDLGGDSDPAHVANYARSPLFLWLIHLGRLLVGYVVSLLATPIVGLRHGTWRDRAFIFIELLIGVALVAFGVAAALRWPAAARVILDVWVIPMLLLNLLFNVRSLSQHATRPASDNPLLSARSIHTSRFAAFFLCNSNYHLEHHLHPGIPWYNLPKVHIALGEALRAHGGLYVRSYRRCLWRMLAGRATSLTR